MILTAFPRLISSRIWTRRRAAEAGIRIVGSVAKLRARRSSDDVEVRNEARRFLVSLASWASACEGISGVSRAVADIGFDLFRYSIQTQQSQASEATEL